MKSYKIYLTKSFDAARVICEGLKREEPWTLDGGKMYLVYLGEADGKSLIPEIYQGRGYYYACIEYRNGPDESRPKYEIVICMVSTWICGFLCLCAAVFGLALGMTVTCLMVTAKDEKRKDEKTDGK